MKISRPHHSQYSARFPQPTYPYGYAAPDVQPEDFRPAPRIDRTLMVATLLFGLVLGALAGWLYATLPPSQPQGWGIGAESASKVSAIDVAALEPCPTEDSQGVQTADGIWAACFWDGSARGNGIGDSVVQYPDGSVVVVD